MKNEERADAFVTRFKTGDDWLSLKSIILSHDDDVRRDLIERLDLYLFAKGISVNVDEMHDAVLGESIIGLMP